MFSKKVASNSIESCILCKNGTFSEGVGEDNEQNCLGCPSGFAQSKPGKTYCLPCLPGSYQSNSGQSICIKCRINTFRPSNNVNQSCQICENGKYTAALKGSSLCIDCIPGKYGANCKNCPQGYKRSEDDLLTSCQICEIGQTTIKHASVSCEGCNLGSYGSAKGKCSLCKTNFYQDKRGQKSCLPCPEGQIPNDKRTACIKVDRDYVIASDCKAEKEYFNDTDSNRLNHTCLACSTGSNCSQLIINGIKQQPKLSLILPLNGYWRIPNEYGPGEELFGRCPYPQDCKTNSTTGQTCQHNSKDDLCFRCKIGYDRISSKCSLCADNEIGLRIFAIVVSMFIVVVLIFKFKQKIRKLHRKYGRASRDVMLAVKILISFLQINMSLPGMISTFDFPEKYILFLNRLQFVNVDVLSILGITCVVDYDFRYSMLVSLLMPILVVITAVFIYLISKRWSNRHVQDPKKRNKIIGKLFDVADHDHSNEIDIKELMHIVQVTRKKKVTLKQVEKIAFESGGTLGYFNTSITLNKKQFIDAINAEIIVAPDVAISYISRTSLQSACMSGAVQLLLMLHAPVSAKAFHYFDCHHLGSKKSLLRRDYSLDCNSTKYLEFLPVGILILFFAIAFPILLASFLIYHRNDLHEPMTRQHIGWLYSRFNPGAEWWEIHEVVRRMILCGLLVYFPPKSRAAIAILVCLTSCCTLNYFKPHKK